MKWSWRMGSIAGIGIDIHATFPILLVWAALAQYQRYGTLEAAVGGVFLILGVFAIVVLHELGHALAARRYGIPTRRITLLPIGGVAELERMPDEPRQELVVAIAGPAVNVALVLTFSLLFVLTGAGSVPPPTEAGIVINRATVLAMAIWINLSLALFNLLPAFPMDGGRILRALLAMRRGYAEATEIAARVGKGFALLFAFVGLFFNPMLVFIALFIWIGAAGETQATQLKSTLDSVPVETIMITDILTLEVGDSLVRAVDHILAGFQEDFPVLAGGRVVGLLTRSDLIRALSAHGEDAPVELAMRREFQIVGRDDLVGEAYTRFQGGQRTLPVLENGELLGLLTLENIAEYIMIQNALSGAKVAAT